MRRFRFTLIAVCLMLLFLGVSDLNLWFNNQTPQTVTVETLAQTGAPQEWLQVTAGYQDLDRAISTSGSLEMEALLVPLVTHPDQQQIRIMVETRNPHLLELFRDYHFLTDTIPDKQSFRREHGDEFKGQRDITGMLVAGLIARGNQHKLLKLAQETGLDIAGDVIFLSEGKEPERWRGVFFTVVGLLGLFKVLTHKQQADKPESLVA
ncbi:MAG: hypothetical protein OEL80_01285 [Desulfuromonadales bacterium]|jgi:hypothetical protein|nr:hypothetical protein [Desulfuromonadales bacterium]